MGYRHTLDKPERFETSVNVPGNQKDFHGEWLKITHDGMIEVSERYSWDGCTLSPDFDCVLYGSIFHDAIYQFAEVLAAHWECSVRKVLKFGDKVFYEASKSKASKYNPIPWIYYRAVRIAGYSFHQLMLWWRR